MAYRILLRRDTSANWIYNNPVLMSGEPGYETNTGKLKIGDGETPWVDLDYYIGFTSISTATGITGGANGFSGPVPSDAGKQPYGWILMNIGGTGYYIPAWTLE